METTVRCSRWLLRSLGIWPMIVKNPSTTERYISKFSIIICVTSMAILVIPPMIHTALREKNTVVRIVRLGPIVSCLSSIVKYGFIIRRCELIKLCVKHMEDDWTTVVRNDELSIMTRNAKFGYRLTVTACVFMYTGGIFYHTMMPLIKGTTMNERNETVRPLVYSGFDMFVDSQKSPIYEIVFWTTFVASFVRYTVAIACCNLAAVFVTHVCGQAQIVVSRINELFDGIDGETNNEKIRKRIASVVRCHVRSLRLSSRIEKVLREICLIEVVAATLIICLLEYYCMTEWNNSETMAIITYIILLLSYVFNLFIFCYIGELLQDQCYEVGKSTYLMDWYRLRGKTGLALVMILAISNYPRKITAGGMIEVSVASFGMIMKTSLMYLNVLRKMSD